MIYPATPELASQDPYERLRSEGPIRPRALVIDDDPEVAGLLVPGARAVAPDLRSDFVATCAEATDWLRRARFDLVLADLCLLDDECGLALRGPCRTVQPDACFALMSSTPREDVAGGVGLEIPFLAKPFSQLQCRGFFVRALP